MYIQTKMDFLDISSLGTTYQYSIKIEQKFKQQNKWDSSNPQQPKYGTRGLTHKTTKLKKTSPSYRKRRVTRRQRRKLGSGVTSKKSLGTTPMNVAKNHHWWSISKKKSRALTHNLIQKIIK
jgi:hypothetical protein